MKQLIFTTTLILIFGISVFSQIENLACPKIEVVGGGIVNPGDSMEFSAKLSDEAKNLNLEYEWTVSAGTIANGQRTLSIVVDTTGFDGQNIEAKIRVKGLTESCANTASEVGSVMQKLPLEKYDEYEKATNDEVKARMDAVFIEIGNNPNFQGYIINYGTEEEISVREKQIRKAIIFRKYDVNQIKLVRCGANPNGVGVVTKVWIILPSFKIGC
jgi:hypothetical protein